MNILDEWYDSVGKMSFSEKLSMVKRVNDLVVFNTTRNHAAMLRYDGYLNKFIREGVQENEGEHYVYLWKHAWGDPFYVGSGTGDRWTAKSGRCADFYLHLDAADAVVYLVLSNVDSKTAHLYERYISANLSDAGYVLANGDNNAEYKTEAARERMMARCKQIEGLERTKKIEGAVYNILSHNSRCDYRVTDQFLMEYGTDFFSRKYLFDKDSCRA